jgi:hypothetical protein
MDIFISYASVDRERAMALADALTRASASVWWDRTIPPGRVFDEVIQEAIAAARCMIVLWSGESVRSNWVKTEAAEGAARGMLVPALLEDVAPPIEFRRIQAANLVDWHGDDDDPAFQQLLASVTRLLQPALNVEAAPLRAHVPTGGGRGATLKAFGLGALSAALLVLGGWQWLHEDPGTAGNGRRAPTPRLAEQPAQADDAVPAAARPAPRATRVNLLADANGGQMLIASAESWSRIVDGNEDSYGWTDQGYAVFGFGDGRTARFDTFTVLVRAQDNANLRDFELFAGNDGPDGPFQSLGRFKTRNLRLMQNPYQSFSFAPTEAKYFKFQSLRSHTDNTAAFVHEVQLFGELLPDAAR